MESTKIQNSINYLSVLPLNQERIDLSVFGKLNKALPFQIIDCLLNKTGLEAGLLLAINEETEPQDIHYLQALQATFNLYKQHHASISIGYPLLILEDETLNKTITAPLFLWDIEIKDISGQPDKWLFQLEMASSGQMNKPLRTYLESRFEFDWDETVGIVSRITPKTLGQITRKIAEKIGLGLRVDDKLLPCPHPKQNIEKTLIWSAVIGSFGQRLPLVKYPEPAAGEEKSKSIVKTDKDKSQLSLEKTVHPKKKWKTILPALATNAEQEKVLRSFAEDMDLLIQGASQTGKTHAIAGMLPSLLADGGKVLIVSEKSASFKDIQYHLEQLGLGDVGILSLQDEEPTEKERFIQYIEQLPKKIKASPKINIDQYKSSFERFLRMDQLLDQAHKATHTKILEGKDWTEVTGQFLAKHHIEGKQLLYKKMIATDFDFTEEEYLQLTQELAANEELYGAVNTLTHPFNDLSVDLFINNNLEEANKKVSEGLNDFYRRARDLYHRYLVFMNDYSDDLEINYENQAKEMLDLSDSICADIRLFGDIYGSDFGNSSNLKLRIFGIFSKHHKEVRTAREKLYTDYERLQELHNQHNYFEAKLPDLRGRSIKGFDEKILLFKKELLAWRKRIPKWVDQKRNELTTKLPTRVAIKQRLEDTEAILAKLASQMNDSGLFSKKFHIDGDRLISRDGLIQELLGFLTLLKKYLWSFPDYYYWRRNWLAAHPLTQAAVTALEQVQSRDWQAAFQSWYLYHLLKKRCPEGLPHEDLPIQEYAESISELRPLVCKYVSKVCSNRQAEQLKQLKKEKELSPKNARDIFQNKSIKMIFDWLGLEAISSIFPIILASPKWCDQLFANSPAHSFDTLLIDDGHLMSADRGEKLLPIAHQRVVFGLPAKEENSILAALAKRESFHNLGLEIAHSKDASVEDPIKIAGNFVDYNTFTQEVYDYLLNYLKPNRLEMNTTIGGIHVDLLVESKSDSGAPIAILCDGWFKGQPNYGYELAVRKHKVLLDFGCIVHSIWSYNWWRSPERAAESLVAFIIRWDDQHRK